MPDKAVVTIDKTKVTPDTLIKAVKKAGYSAKLKNPDPGKAKKS